MPLYKHPKSPYWQIRFEIAGREINQSSRTRDKRLAEEMERRIRADVWKQLKLGETRWTWDDAVAKFTEECRHQRSWDRTERCLTVLTEYLGGELLTAIDYEALLAMRTLLEQRTGEGHGHKMKKTWRPSTVKRVIAVASAVLQRCASDDWKRMIERAPTIPTIKVEKADPRWITREQAQALLAKLPKHSADLMRFALATGLRRSNVTEMEWSRIDIERQCCYVPGMESKTGEPIPVPLNADAMAVLHTWKQIHERMRAVWPAAVHRYVFVYRGKAPIYKVTTRAWREACAAAGLEGVTFHSMRHSWASWQVQAETPLKILQELGGWSDLQMPLRYAHLSPGHLAAYADRSLLKGTDALTRGKTPNSGTDTNREET